MEYYKAKKGALVYPGTENRNQSRKYSGYSSHEAKHLSNEECSLISIGVENDVKVRQKLIYDNISNWSQLHKIA
ncbi:hypothetical protein [Yeosuana aromativorans]|nr:hypothetical protein [Yeosuana aromativorans]